MLRAAVVSSFFLVKTVKPAPVFKKLAAGGTVQLPTDPGGTKYYQLERDPFLFNVNQVVQADERGAASTPGSGGAGAPASTAALDGGAAARQPRYVAHRNPQRYHTNANSLFAWEGPSSTYMVHTSIFAQGGNLTLDTMSEASPLAILLLGTFCYPIEFRNDGLIVIDKGKIMFTTTGVSVITQKEVLQHDYSMESAAEKAKSKENTLISILVKMLREELQENVLGRKIADPSYDLENNEVIRAVKVLIATDGMGL